MSTDGPVRIEKKDGVGTIILNRPRSLNILDTEALQLLDKALAGLEKDEGIRSIIPGMGISVQGLISGS